MSSKKIQNSNFINELNAIHDLLEDIYHPISKNYH